MALPTVKPHVQCKWT